MAIAQSRPKKTMEQFKGLPKQVQQVCKDAAFARYERHYHPRHKHHRKHLIVDAVLAALLLLLAGFSAYVFFYYRSAVLREGIDLAIVPMRETVQSGEEFSYTLKIQNFTDQSLSNVEAEFPSAGGFIVSGSSKGRLSDNRLNIGSLSRGEERSYEVRGYTVGSAGETVRLNVILYYTPTAFLLADQKLTSETVEVVGSSLETQLMLPDSIIANQPFPFTISYHNMSPATHFEQVTFLPAWPPGWEVLQSDLPLEEENDFWKIESIGSLEKGTIQGEAQLLTSDLEEAEITFNVFAAPLGIPLLQQDIKQVIPVRYPNVDVTAEPSRRIVALGQELDFAVSVTNQEEGALINGKAVFQLDRALFSTSSLAVNEQSEVAFDLFEQLAPGQNIDEVFAFRLLSQINPSLAFGNRSTAISVPVTITYEDENGQNISIPVKPAPVNINTDLQGQAFARYHSAEGDQIGRGPLPPRVGETTKYWVFIHLTNQIHTLENVTVEAKIPSGIDWTGKKSITAGESLNFSEATRAVNWQVGTMPDYKTNFAKNNFGAAFELAVTPRPEQAGQELLLVDSIQIQGRDRITGQIITFTPADVTSVLLNDSYAVGDGKVVE